MVVGWAGLRDGEGTHGDRNERVTVDFGGGKVINLLARSQIVTIEKAAAQKAEADKRAASKEKADAERKVAAKERKARRKDVVQSLWNHPPGGQSLAPPRFLRRQTQAH